MASQPGLLLPSISGTILRFGRCLPYILLPCFLFLTPSLIFVNLLGCCTLKNCLTACLLRFDWVFIGLCVLIPHWIYSITIVFQVLVTQRRSRQTTSLHWYTSYHLLQMILLNIESVHAYSSLADDFTYIEAIHASVAFLLLLLAYVCLPEVPTEIYLLHSNLHHWNLASHTQLKLEGVLFAYRMLERLLNILFPLHLLGSLHG